MFRRFFVSFIVLAALCVPAAVSAAPTLSSGGVAGVSDQSLAIEIGDQVRTYVYYTIFDDVQGMVSDGVVTLTGKVTDPYKATQIAKRVKRVQGVREVDNKIQSLPVSIFDNELRAEIAARIYRDPMFWNYAMQVNPPIHIIVENGHVTLTGVVNSEVERRVAGGETADRIADGAKASGMKSLWDSGLAHVLKGESSIDELLRVVDVPQEEAPPAAAAAPRPSRRSGTAQAFGFGSDPAIAEPDAPAPPVSTHFDLLEEPAKPRTSGAHGAPACKVLLVDDEDSLRNVMKDLLERDGYIVTEARDGVQALDQVDRIGPDIIVLDLNLPGLDGYGVLSHLRSRPSTAHIPVIVLTAKGDEDNEVRVFELGADDFLTKPFRARALSARLEAVLGRRR